MFLVDKLFRKSGIARAGKHSKWRDLFPGRCHIIVQGKVVYCWMTLLHYMVKGGSTPFSNPVACQRCPVA